MGVGAAGTLRGRGCCEARESSCGPPIFCLVRRPGGERGPRGLKETRRVHFKACKGEGESESANGLGRPRTRDLYLRQARIQSSDSRDRTDLQKMYEAGAKQVRWPRPFQQRGEVVPVKHNALCVIGAGRPARCGVRAACCSSRVAWQGQPPGGQEGRARREGPAGPGPRRGLLCLRGRQGAISAWVRCTQNKEQP